MAGPFDHHLAAVIPRDLGQLAERLELGELRAIVGVGNRSGTKSVAERERHVVAPHDLADLVEALIEEALFVMGEAPFGHDRAASGDDAGHARRGEMDVAEPHPRVDGEIIDALLGLLDQRVLVDVPVELDGIAVDLLQRLIDRHRADRDGRVPDDPFARQMDIATGGKVHHRVGAPAGCPHHLLDLLLDRAGHRGVADIGVDLGEEVPADDHRLGFRVIDIGGDDGATARDFAPHELRRHERGQRGTEALAVGEPGFGFVGLPRASETLASEFSRCAT